MPPVRVKKNQDDSRFLLHWHFLVVLVVLVLVDTTTVSRTRPTSGITVTMIRLTDFPDDILEDVFDAMRNLICFPGEHDYHPVTQLEYPLEKSVPLWANVIVLSHVCSHWRNLMCTRPHLWTFIRVTGTFKNRVMVNEMIERSKLLPLSILFTYRAETVVECRDDGTIFDLVAIASILSDHSERFQELGIVLHSKDLAMIMNALSAAVVPRLEKLWFHCGLQGSTGGKSEVSWTSLFDRMLPPLRVLHMDHITSAWLPFENLERLELTGGPAPPLSALLHTLRHSPLLKTLVLQILSVNTEGVDEADGVEGETRIILPYLRLLDLRVGSTYKHAFSVLPYIAFPQTTAVLLSFSCRFTSSLSGNCDSLQDLAAAIEHTSLVIRSPNIADIFSEQSSLQLMYQVCPYENISQDPEDVFHSHIARLCEGFRAVPLPSLTSLTLTIEAQWIEYTRSRFMDLLQAVPTITHLALNVGAAEAVALFGALGELVGGEEDAKVSVCPRLKEISVNMTTWPTDDDFWCLERCCHARASAGVPIERLETLKFPEIVLSSLQSSVQTIIANN
ncbi:hypothetical protein C8Q80DRAFT_1354301 [Daedaleopsis nitida]|nr:hypothetical protein C8Q80DRAFT_1354301 [Daedaleopsis nitida]